MTTEEKDAVNFKEDKIAGHDGRADWHPYRVWQDKIRSDEDSQAVETPQNIDLTGSWKPLSVWKKQIKRA